MLYYGAGSWKVSVDMSTFYTKWRVLGSKIFKGPNGNNECNYMKAK